MKSVKVLLVGIGGYGAVFVREALDNPRGDIIISGVADPYPERCIYYDELIKKNIPIYNSMDEFYAEKDADLAVIATPIFLHTEQMLTALRNGSNVLCEKPLCADERDIEILSVEKEKSKKNIFIGYQWSYSEAIKELKGDILKGKFGKLIQMKTLCLRPRTRDYFERGVGWAGKIKTPDGKLVYDSVANNSAAHYLFNMLYIMGKDGMAAEPENISACLLRGNKIENFDACKIDFSLSEGAKASFIAAHPVNHTVEPVFCYRFEKGTVYYSTERTSEAAKLMPKEYDEYGKIVAFFADGQKKVYKDPMADSLNKLHEAVKATKEGNSSFELCGLLAAAVHTKMINYIQKNFEIFNIKPMLLKEEDGLLYAEGLFEEAMKCYKDVGRTFEKFLDKK